MKLRNNMLMFKSGFTKYNNMRENVGINFKYVNTEYLLRSSLMIIQKKFTLFHTLSTFTLSSELILCFGINKNINSTIWHHNIQQCYGYGQNKKIHDIKGCDNSNTDK